MKRKTNSSHQDTVAAIALALQGRNKGMFITFEGGDGSGKTTQMQILADALTDQRLELVTTREPGGTTLGGQLRDLIQHGQHVSSKAETLMFAADRAQHVDELIRPALVSGTTVLCDRYIDSSVAYQGAARGLGTGEVRDLSQWATGGLEPDLTILLDIEPRLGLRRATRHGADRIEQEGLDFQERVRQEYLHIATQNPGRTRVVDASGSITSVSLAVAETVLNFVSVVR